MNRLIAWLFALVLFIAPACTSAHSLEHATAVALDSSVRIEMFQGPYGWVTIASGVAVRKNSIWYTGDEPKFAIATAQHVAIAEALGYDLRACSIFVADDCVDVGTFISNQYETIGNDWGLMLVDELPASVKPAHIRRDTVPRLAETVVIIGHPWGEFMIADGIMGAYRVDETAALYYVVQGFVAPGSSGGGVFDKHGRLIGLVSAMPVEADPVTGIPRAQEDVVFVVPIRSIGL